MWGSRVDIGERVWSVRRIHHWSDSIGYQRVRLKEAWKLRWVYRFPTFIVSKEVVFIGRILNYEQR